MRDRRPVTDPYECWLPAERVPAFLRGLAEHLDAPLDLEQVLDGLLDTDVERRRWLVLPLPGPLHVELAGEPGTGAVEVRARPTGPGADEVLAALRPLGALPGR